MRLIDAEKCPCKGCPIEYCHENCKKYYAWLDGCDYDVEAVVAELEKLKESVFGCDDTKCSKCKYKSQCFNVDKGHKVALGKAITIVRGKDKCSTCQYSSGHVSTCMLKSSVCYHERRIVRGKE